MVKEKYIGLFFTIYREKIIDGSKDKKGFQIFFFHNMQFQLKSRKFTYIYLFLFFFPPLLFIFIKSSTYIIYYYFIILYFI